MEAVLDAAREREATACLLNHDAVCLAFPLPTSKFMHAPLLDEEALHGWAASRGWTVQRFVDANGYFKMRFSLA